MRNCSLKKRPITIGALSALALLLLACVIPPAERSVQTCLNLVWLLLAAGIAAHGASRAARRHLRSPEVLGFVFILALLFPVISPNDDLAQMYLANEANTAQSVVAVPEYEKRWPAWAKLLNSPATISVFLLSCVLQTFEFLSDTIPSAAALPAAQATGNHSPPLS